jgi:mannose-6-phosphate isomerase-like protein (cupin superfamily)
MIFKLKDAGKFKLEGLKGWSYSTNVNFSRASAAYIEVNGRHGKVMSKVSDKIYLVIDGEGKFIIEGNEFPVGKSDVIIVPRETEYDYEGEMNLFLVYAPAFGKGSEVNTSV